MSKTKQLKFKGKPIFESPTFGIHVNNKVGKEIAAKVNEKFKGTPAELTLPNRNKPITHSNTFRLFAIDQAARAYDARVIRPEEAQLLRVTRNLPEATITYKDLGAVLDFSGNNHDLAMRLYEQLTKKELDRFPAVLTGLGVEKTDSKSYGGLIFVPTPYTLARIAPVIAKGRSGNFDDNDGDLLKTGLPSKVGKGNRYLYVASQGKKSLENLGLCRFSLCESSYLDADEPDLAGAGVRGRVVLFSGEASAPENLLALHKQRKSELSNRIQRVNLAYDRAVEEAQRILE